MPILGKSQAPDTSTIENLQRYVAGPLDKSQVPTGFLEDYGAPFIPMAAFNGNLSDSNKIEMSLWRLLYFQLQTSYCQTGTNTLPSIVTVNESLKNANTASIPISILLGQYAKIKDDAYTNNLLSFNSSNNRIYDVAGRSQSPYTTNYLFAAAPLQANNVTNTASFVYNPSLVWANTGLSISQLQVNFDDGQGLRTLAPNTPVNITYADTGFHTITIKATLSNNEVLQCYSTYYVLTVSNTQARYTPLNIENPGWGIIAPVSGVHGGGTISYILSTTINTGQLKKPLIVAENMDIFGIAPSLQNAPYEINALLNSLDQTRSSFYDFNEALDVAQYDLVFVNFTKGEDGVVNNAQVFKEAITKINNNKGGDLQNVVLGIGTGGIIARYALAEVTRQSGGNPTQTRLLITHDAPHRGANIALGIQMMTRMLGSYNYFGITARQIFPEYDETMKYYDAPINQDILLYRSTSDQNFNTNTFINAVYQPMVNYISPYRFVATSLGNECANELMPAGSKFIDMGMEVYAKLKGKVFWGLVSVTLVKVNYETLIYARAVPTATDGNRKIASVKCVFALKLFGAINIAKTGYDKTVSASTSIIPYDGVPGSNQQTLGFNSLREYYNALEFLSGASTILNTANSVYQYIVAIEKAIKAIKTAKTLMDVLQSPGFVGLSLKAGFTAETQSFFTEYTYLPVGSALDVDPFNTNTFTQKYVNGVNLNHPSKSNNFIAQETVTSQGLYNNASMRFTARNARFLFNEMEGLPNFENCSNECSNPYLISGSNIICTNGSFSIPGLPTGSSVTWTVSPLNIADLSCINCLAPTLTKENNGKVMLTATVTNACFLQGFQVQREITIGTPSPYIGGTFNDGGSGGNQPLESTVNEVLNTTVYISLSGSPFQFTWENFYTNGNVSWYHPTVGNEGLVINFYPPPIFYGDYIGFDITSTNICGIASEPLFFYYAGPTQYYRVAPNPVQSTFTITQLEQKKLSPLIPKKKEVSKDLIKIQIIDKMGKQVFEQSFSNYTKSATINVSALKSDIYTVRLFTKDHEELHKIVVQH